MVPDFLRKIKKNQVFYFEKTLLNSFKNQTKEIKNRLKREKGTYYDPFYLPIVDFLDPLNKTLIRAAKRRLSAPSQQLDEYLKDREFEKNNIDILLGKKEEIPRTYGKDEGLEMALNKARIHREKEKVAEEVKTDFHMNKARKEPYYDSTSERRFKQIKKKHSKKSKKI